MKDLVPVIHAYDCGYIEHLGHPTCQHIVALLAVRDKVLGEVGVALEEITQSNHSLRTALDVTEIEQVAHELESLGLKARNTRLVEAIEICVRSKTVLPQKAHWVIDTLEQALAGEKEKG